MPRVAVEVSRLLESISADVLVEGDAEVDHFDLGEERFDAVSPVVWDVSVTNTGAGIVASGTATVTVRAECSRCLEPFDLEVVGNVEGFYVTPSHASSIPEKQEYELIEDERIDLWPAIEAAVAIELPFVPLHSEECKGICPQCGCNLNEERCDCAPAAEESPFAVLKDRFPPKE